MIFVNDGSTDQTLQELIKLEKNYSYLKVINSETNRGYGASLKKEYNFRNMIQLLSRMQMVLIQMKEFQN